jgi:hypothetical protein
MDKTRQKPPPKPGEPLTTYHERQIGKTLYRVTSVYKGEIELGKALEDLTVRKILQSEGVIPHSP